MSNIPESLINAIKEQRAVLFLGAGASRDAEHPEGKRIPQSSKLRDLICDKFLDGKLKKEPLNFVATLATNEVGILEFQRYICDLLLSFEPSDFHLLIPKFRWRAIVTTNLDLIVEKAYDSVEKRLQNLVKTVKDGDSFDTRLQEKTNPVGFFKLHGCINHFTDSDIPFVLGNEQYASYKNNRTRFYNRFRDLGYEHSVIFAGYSISDPHIQELLFDLSDSKISRPPYYLISPDITDVEEKYWARYRVVVIKSTFQKFLQEINSEIPSLAKKLSVDMIEGDLSIRKHYRTAHPTEPLSLVSYLESDATHVHLALIASKQDPKEFYRGYDNGWDCILSNLDVRRSFSDSVLFDAILLSEESRQTVELFMLKGPGGNGKSVSLKRIAWESGVIYDQLVLHTASSAGLRIEPLSEIYRLTGKRIFLFVDHVALFRDELKVLLERAKQQSLQLTVIGAERHNEWNIYCEELEPFLCQEFSVGYLNKREIDSLLDLLECHEALGLLKDLTPDERVTAFKKRAERQLLVALHEATLGAPFEDIVFDEFNRIEPPTARNIYLNICALHQFGTQVRAGLISRTTGIRFEQFRTEFIQPLEKIIHVVQDKHSQNIYYRCRHQHVAEILFNRALVNEGDKFDLLVKLIKEMNIDYSSDLEAFSRVMRGRNIAKTFSDYGLGQLFYDHVQEALPDSSFVLHQLAVFEMRHPGGSLMNAEKATTQAFKLNPSSRSIKHTQAEIARRMALETEDLLRKRALRRVVREKLGGNTSRFSEYEYSTHARLAVDEFRELLDLLNGDYSTQHEVVFDVAKEIQILIQGSLQSYPESTELLTIESNFKDLLNQKEQAQQILERAFRLNPRQDWLAVRLSRRYRDSGDILNAERVLKECLNHNHSSKIVHFEIGCILSESRDLNAVAHLRSSFTFGDNNYEAQFWCARELFLRKRFDKAKELFNNLHERAPSRFRRSGGIPVKQDKGLVEYEGSIIRKEEDYAFLKFSEFSENIFASRAESNPEEWSKLYRNANINCVLAFSRRGPRAMSIRLSSSGKTKSDY